MSGKKLPMAARICIAVAATVILAFFAELMFNIKLLTDDGPKGQVYLSIQDMSTKNAEIQSDGTLLIKKGSAAISFDVNRYVDRLVVQYEKEGYFDQIISAVCINGYGCEEVFEFNDNAPQWLDRSSHNIRKNVKTITLQFDADRDFTISTIGIDNTPCINVHRLISFMMLFLCVGLLVVLRKIIAEKIELGFLIAALTMGIAFIITMPLVRTGFDEEAHLRNTFLLSVNSQSAADDEIWEMLNTSDKNNPYYHCDTADEYSEFYSYLNENANYFGTWDREEYTITPRHTSGLATFAYAPVALVINICKIIKLGFADIIIAARTANLIFYALVMFFAIKRLKKGKILMALTALMPTSLFLASTVSYDPVVTSCIYLGLAYILNVMTDDKEKVVWWKAALAVVAMGYGCMAKAIYAPLVLIALFIPKDRYKDKKTRRIVIGGVVLAFAVLMLSFILPELISGGGDGDIRGGNTSHGGQMGAILSNPFTYGALLIKSVGTNILRYTIGPAALDILNLLGYGNTIIAIDALLIFVLLTYSDDDRAMSLKARAGTAIMCLMSAILIWSALYLSYTEVGVTDHIAGVQGRYFIPMLVPLMMLVPSEKIKTGFAKDRIKYNCVVFLIIVGILFWEIYSQILKVCTF